MSDDNMTTTTLQVPCKQCGRPMAVRRRRVDDSEFLGCTGWPHHCRHTEPLPEDLRMRRMGAPTMPGLST